MVDINNERLIMRGWRESDLAPWAAMNADPEVRQYLGPLLTFEQASAWVLHFQDDLDRRGYGFWAVEVRASGGPPGHLVQQRRLADARLASQGQRTAAAASGRGQQSFDSGQLGCPSHHGTPPYPPAERRRKPDEASPARSASVSALDYS